MKPDERRAGQACPDRYEGITSGGGKRLWAAILSTDHKRIGTFYFAFSILGGVVGVALSLLVRVKLDTVDGSGMQLLSLFSSAHGLIMTLFMMVPALFGGFGNWLVPLMTGAGELAFPRVNRAAFWLFALAFVLFTAVLPVIPAGFSPVLWLLAILHSAGIAVILLAVNFIVTIITMRAPAIQYNAMPPFVWSVLVASFLLLMCLPVMAAATTLFLGAHAFASVKQVFFDGLQLQVMLWFFSHPETYVLLLPAFGIISHVVTTFSNAPLYAEKGVVAAMVLIGAAGFILWTRNMFYGSGDMADMKTYLLFSLPVVGLPAMFIVVSWLLTMAHGHVRWQVPMLWAGGFLFTLAMGALSAGYLALGRVFPGQQAGFVAHFHYTLSLGAVFVLFAGWYFWFPKMSGVKIRAFTGKLHFWMMFVAVHMIFLPQVAAFSGGAQLAMAGTVTGALSAGVFVYGIVEAWVRRAPAGNNPWGEGAVTREWRLSSPPQKILLLSA